MLLCITFLVPPPFDHKISVPQGSFLWIFLYLYSDAGDLIQSSNFKYHSYAKDSNLDFQCTFPQTAILCFQLSPASLLGCQMCISNATCHKTHSWFPDPSVPPAVISIHEKWRHPSSRSDRNNEGQLGLFFSSQTPNPNFQQILSSLVSKYV